MAPVKIEIFHVIQCKCVLVLSISCNYHFEGRDFLKWLLF